ncbi:MAG: four helix bundle protein [Gemmatimonadales bacterium]|nr:four helix bundle protein [Gemmatimonadales bacterium]
MAPYEGLRAWQAAHGVVLRVYEATASWPKHELYGLVSQARRAAVSVAANIAEGGAKRGDRELRRFLDIALGSTVELSYLLRLARDLGLLSEPEWRELERQRNEAGKMLWRLYQATSKRAAR